MHLVFFLRSFLRINPFLLSVHWDPYINDCLLSRQKLREIKNNLLKDVQIHIFPSLYNATQVNSINGFGSILYNEMHTLNWNKIYLWTSDMVLASFKSKIKLDIKLGITTWTFVWNTIWHLSLSAVMWKQCDTYALFLQLQNSFKRPVSEISSV